MSGRIAWRMDALLRAGILLALPLCLGANYGSQQYSMASSAGSCRSQHFVVSAPSAAFARQVCEAAERFRRDLAIEWLGEELPAWPDICPIQVKAGANLGAGGATSFTFINGQPRDWHMEIQGSQARILDSVLPHEISHTIFASHFGRPLPRWADEGAATSVEHVSERSKQQKLLIQFLTTDRGIAFNHMFAMKEYPRDILPLYSQGYSLARYLIARGGKRKFIEYVGDGMKWNNWTAATEKHYGIRSLSELQITWLDWVRGGSRPVSNTLVADSGTVNSGSSTPIVPAAYASQAGVQGERNANPSGMIPLPSRLTPLQGQKISADARPASASQAIDSKSPDGWYSRQRDRALQGATSQTSSSASTSTGAKNMAQNRTGQGPATAPTARRTLLEWSRSDHQQLAGTATVLR